MNTTIKDICAAHGVTLVTSREDASLASCDPMPIDAAKALVVALRGAGHEASWSPGEGGAWIHVVDRDARNADRAAELAAIVGDDGTDNLRVIVDASPDATIEELAEIVREARADWAEEQAYQAQLDAAEARRMGGAS